MGFVVHAGVRNVADGAKLLTRSSDRIKIVVIDVTDTDSIVAARDTMRAELGENGLYGLVNNAGIAVAGPLELLPLADFRRQLEVNVTGQLAVFQAFAPLLRSARGRLVNMSSVSGRTTFPLLGAYSASKFALEALSDALRMELRESGIFVSVIEPGVVATRIWKRSTSEAHGMLDHVPAASKEPYQAMIAGVEQAKERMARHAISPARVAKAVGAALSAQRPRARYIVGIDCAFVVYFLRFIPDRVRDWLILRALRR
jgi:NAD(P)-dependent dehydrogenase (short-subunit alcohol dehydrogenase family)